MDAIHNAGRADRNSLIRPNLDVGRCCLPPQGCRCAAAKTTDRPVARCLLSWRPTYHLSGPQGALDPCQYG